LQELPIHGDPRTFPLVLLSCRRLVTARTPTSAVLGDYSMIAKHILKVFGEFAFRFISKKVDILVTRCGFSKSEREDLYQDFALDLFTRSEKYDPKAASWEGFVVVVCENHFADILAHRFAEMRTRQREKHSLNEPVAGKDGKQRDRSDKVDECHHYNRTGRRFRSRQEGNEMSDDVIAVIAGLTDFQRAICAKLMHVGVSASSRELGVSRAAVIKEVGLIRQRFEQAGLRDYL
jgi:RNA polymerase sigma-70 factor (ECF subfamily)